MSRPTGIPDRESMPDVAILEPARPHRRLVEQHVDALRLRHSLDLDAHGHADGGALSLDDLAPALAVVHGVDRFSVPALVSLGPDAPWAAAGSSRSSALGLTQRSSALGASGRSLFSSPDHELANTRTRFVGVTRSGAGGACEFLVQVDTGKEQFVVRRRFSEFRDLRLQLLAALKAGQHCGAGACAQLEQVASLKFPRRKLREVLGAAGAAGDLETAQRRVRLLHRFVEAVLRVYRAAPKRQVRRCLNAQCKALEDVRAFLDLGMPEPGTLSLGDSVGPVTDALAAANSPEAERASLSCAHTPDWPLKDGMNVREAVDSRRSLPPPSSSRRSEQLYTISEDLESMHLRG